MVCRLRIIMVFSVSTALVVWCAASTSECREQSCPQKTQGTAFVQSLQHVSRQFQAAELFASSTVGDEFKIDKVPHSFVAHVTVPSDFGDGRVGVIAGSHPNKHSINWEVHSNGKPRLYWNEGEVDWKVDIDLRTGDNQVAFVVNEDGSEAKFYLNGEERSSRSDKFSSVWPAGEILIGGDHRSGNTQEFRVSGGVHCVKVFSHVISEDELAVHCPTPQPTPAPPTPPPTPVPPPPKVWAERRVTQSDLTHLMCGSQNCGVRDVLVIEAKICGSCTSRASCYYYCRNCEDRKWVYANRATCKDGVFTCPATEDESWHHATQRRIDIDNGDGGQFLFTYRDALAESREDCR